MNIDFVASVSVVVREPGGAQALWREALGLAFEGGEGDYVFTERLAGVRHFGVWPLAEAAQACFGADAWPSDLPVPQASIELEVASPEAVDEAAQELRARGYGLLHDAKREPWGQTVTRLLTTEGLIVGVCYTPWFHD